MTSPNDSENEVALWEKGRGIYSAGQFGFRT